MLQLKERCEMTVQKYLLATDKYVKAWAPFGHWNMRPTVYCVDGTKLSVQASTFHKCFPRNNVGPYETVEVGYLSAQVPEEWDEYLCKIRYKIRGVKTYSYVPIELVEEFVLRHGGIDYEKSINS